jgi:predicted flap endonuclease-1-like 5' DNA nuclease
MLEGLPYVFKELKGMSTILTTVLITAPLAFLVGWLLSKVLFRHLTITRPNPAADSNAAAQPDTTPKHTQTLPDIQPTNKSGSTPQELNVLRTLQKRFTASQTDRQALQNETQLLKEAVAERDHRVLELKQQLAVVSSPPEDTQPGTVAMQNAQQAKEMRTLQKRLNANELQIVQLRRELVTAEEKLLKSKAQFKAWPTRIKPLVKQFRQQRMIISELRDEMRERELHREQEAAQQKVIAKSVTNAVPAKQQHPSAVPLPTESSAGPPPVEVRSTADDASYNLQKLRGIGPALHKKLNAQDIFQLQQLADMSARELSKLGESLGVSQKLIVKNDWSKQAQQLLGIEANVDAVTQPTEDVVSA